MEGDERVLFISMPQHDRQRTEKGTTGIVEILMHAIHRQRMAVIRIW
jgi:hypothetical protein